MANDMNNEENRPAIDPEGFRALVEMIGPEMPEVVVDILDTYRQEAAELLAVIVPAAAAADAERMLRPVHSLKSSSASVGASILSALCAALEQHLRGYGPPLDMPAQVAAIEAEYQRVDAALELLRTDFIGQ